MPSRMAYARKPVWVVLRRVRCGRTFRQFSSRGSGENLANTLELHSEDRYHQVVDGTIRVEVEAGAPAAAGTYPEGAMAFTLRSYERMILRRCIDWTKRASARISYSNDVEVF
jgi:hypothetical protein